MNKVIITLSVLMGLLTPTTLLDQPDRLDTVSQPTHTMRYHNQDCPNYKTRTPQCDRRQNENRSHRLVNRKQKQHKHQRCQ